MIDSELNKLLTQIRDYSLELLSLANQEQWDKFRLVLEAREKSTAAINTPEYLEEIANAGSETSIAEFLLEIQQLNHRVVALAEANRENIVSELRQSSLATKAIDAYRR